jgi:hypothetical protein
MNSRDLPLGQMAGVVLGLWLMAAPAVFSYAGGLASDVHRTLGPIAATCGTIALWRVTRDVRLVNIAVGIGLFLLTVVATRDLAPVVNGVACGVVLVAFAPFGGVEGRDFGGGWRSVVPWLANTREG